MTLLSTCCETKPIGGTADGIGICGWCNDTVSFEDKEYDPTRDTKRTPKAVNPYYEGWDNWDNSERDDYDWQQYIQSPTWESTAPYKVKPRSDSEIRLDIGEGCGLSPEIYNNFRPSIISWITDRIAVTSSEGVAQALSDGHFVLNTASEITNNAQVKIAVEPGSGNVLSQLNTIYSVIDNILTTSNQKVVVHCRMGMERSVLSVVWYLSHKYNMTLLRAVELVQSKREIAQNRLKWISQ